jgi:hypothetical protein
LLDHGEMMRDLLVEIALIVRAVKKISEAPQ